MAAKEDTLPHNSLPRYAQIQKQLEQRLMDGVYPIGSLMPSEQELSAEFNSSRTTIREALRYLRERGYVERRQGVGTRVISDTTRSTYFQSFTSLEELFQVAIDTYYVVMEIKTVALDPELGLKPGSWSMQLLRRYVTENGVLIASFNWHPADQMTYLMRIHRSREQPAD